MRQTMNDGILYRDARREDLSQIEEIIGHYIYNTTTSWSYEVQSRRVLKRWLKAHERDRWPVQVAERGGQIVGYACLSHFRDIEGYWPSAENTVYVRPSQKGQGIGRQLMHRLLQIAATKELRSIVAIVDAKNQGSIRFHQDFGFKMCGELNNIGWKLGSWRGIAILKLDLLENTIRKEDSIR